jgi:NADH-quinone oxidoreductase subunit G
MPTLVIDNREVTVPEGTNVLEAARALDIVIPHFCYHEALGAVGACRLCAMKFVDGPVKGLQMACMVWAKDGMVVSTLDPDAVELRSHVIEWLMTNHPHDCPVCDEGGECQLQEMTVAGGHGNRRYTGKKRTYLNQELGPFIAHEMNRCIACYRCVRTYRDYCGGTDFGVFGSRNRVYFGRVRDGQLESPFSGNLVDVCPTGVFTDKTFRFKSRAWDLQEAPSICPHCSLGCATVPGARLRELQRVRAGINLEVNGFFICDRGRFEPGGTNDPQRPRQPRVDGEQVVMAEAVDALRRRLTAIVAAHGPRSVALLGSPRASLEANALLRELATDLGTPHLAFAAHVDHDRSARLTGTHLEAHARSLAEVRHSDLVVLIGTDPLTEGPLLALAIRQAVRAGGRAVVVGPPPTALPFRHTHLPVAADHLGDALGFLAGGTSHTFEEPLREQLAKLRAQLTAAERPILAAGSAGLGSGGINTLFKAADFLSTAERIVGVALLLDGPNSCGAALLAGRGPNFDMLLEGIESGEIRALVCLESDPFGAAGDPAHARAVLGRLERLAVLDNRASVAVDRADIFLPTRTCVETDGVFVNNEGRLQAFARVMEPGLPLRETSPDGHPPREFCSATPGSEPWPAWAILARLLERDADLAALRRQIAEADPRFAPLAAIEPGQPGMRVKLTPGWPHYRLGEEVR